MIEFKAVSLASLLNLRNQYLDSLRYPQELHCEWLVAKGGCFCIEQDGRVVGYFIRSEEGDLIEFYLPDKLFSRKEEIFGRVLEEFQIKSAFCKSFDDLFMACCHAFGQSSKIGGYLFRFFTALNPQLHSRSATYIKRNGLLIRKITIKSSRPFQCAYHPLTP